MTMALSGLSHIRGMGMASSNLKMGQDTLGYGKTIYLMDRANLITLTEMYLLVILFQA